MELVSMPYGKEEARALLGVVANELRGVKSKLFDNPD